MYSINRVAGPTATTRTPVARGSSVPAWPALCRRISRCTRLTTSRDVSPAGLSILSRPNMVDIEAIEGANLVGRLAGQIRQSGGQRRRVANAEAGEPMEL